MAYGLTDQGFLRKPFSVIVEETEQKYRDIFGKTINLLPTELLGQIIGITCFELDNLWQLSESIYNQWNIFAAQGVSLDNLLAFTGHKRLAATKGTGTITAYGALGTIIPAGSIVSVQDNPEARFVTISDAEIAAGINEVQLIQFSSVPDAGQYTLKYDGEETSTLNFNSNAAAIQSALNGLSSLSSVTVSGNYTSGFNTTFTGVDGSQDKLIIQVGENTLSTSSVSVSVSITETTKGVLPHVDIDVIAETAGAIEAYAGTLNVIETAVAGWESVTNENDIVSGKDVETDSQALDRRNLSLSIAGESTLEALKSRLLAIDEVTQARVFENDSDVTDAFGRPSRSFEALVVGGDDQEIIDTIFAHKAAGTLAFGSTTGQAVDSDGFSHEISFSRPTEVNIYVLIDNLEIDSGLFPVDGEEAIKEALVEYASNEFRIGDDVLLNKLHCSIAEISGVLDYDLFIKTSEPVNATANIAIAEDEISVFDTSRVDVVLA